MVWGRYGAKGGGEGAVELGLRSVSPTRSYQLAGVRASQPAANARARAEALQEKESTSVGACSENPRKRPPSRIRASKIRARKTCS